MTPLPMIVPASGPPPATIFHNRGYGRFVHALTATRGGTL